MRKEKRPRAIQKWVIVRMLLLLNAQVSIVRGQSLLDPNVTTDQLMHRQGAGPSVFSPQPGGTGIIPPPAPAGATGTPSPMSPEEIGIQKEIADFISKEGGAKRITSPELQSVLIPKLIALHEKGYEKNVELHGEGHSSSLYWIESLLMLNSEYDWDKACKYGLLTLSWLKKADRATDEAPTRGITAIVQGQVLDLLCQAENWQETAYHARQCEPFFEANTDEDIISKLGNNPPHLWCDRFHQGLLGLGNYYEHQGDIPAAVRWFTRAADFASKILGKKNPYAKSLNALAGLYSSIRDYQREEPLRLEALQVYKQVQGDLGSKSIEAMKDLAWNYNKQGRRTQAEGLLREALSLAQKSPHLSSGGGPVLIARIQSALADVLQRIGKTAEASQLYRESTAVMTRADPVLFPRGSKDLSWAIQQINNGLHLCHFAGKPKEAEEVLTQGISLLETQTSYGWIDIRDRGRRALASAQWQQGKEDAARENARKWAQSYDSRLQFIMRFTTEDQRLSWMDWQAPFDLAASFGMAEDAAHLLLRTKGIILDSILEDRVIAQKSDTAGTGSEWNTLRKTRDDLRQAWAAAEPNLTEVTRLEAEETALQARMAGTAKLRDSFKVTVAQVQNAIPAASSLLDYFRFYGPDTSGQLAERYAVLLLKHEGKPELVVLPWTAAQMDDALNVFRNVMRRPMGLSKDRDGDLEVLMKTLHSCFIAPVSAKLGSVRTLIISPDSELNFLPFATLIDSNGSFLCERFDIRQVNSVRDLVAKPEKNGEPAKKIALYGNAQFHLGNTPGPVTGKSQALLEPLPGTKREIEIVSKRAQAAGWSVDVRQGVQASEGNVRTTKCPGVLHLATHGFFMERVLPEQIESALNLAEVEGRPQRLRTLFDPMSRSGILLSGAENRMEEWTKGISFPLADDGVLTAAEAGNLDLRNTWLVVLSACDTGIGDSVSGEGVMGLRRAFFYAGARNVMISLWPVKDEATADFIDDFYAKAFSTGDAATALSEAQRSWLLRLRKKQSLWETIKLGGAFILVGSGR